VEVYTKPLKVTAASLVPSAELATEYHALLGAPQALQVAPKSVDVSINPRVGDAATNLAPSADEATDDQTQPIPSGALVKVQSCALEGLTIANSNAEAATANTTAFVFICVSNNCEHHAFSKSLIQMLAIVFTNKTACQNILVHELKG
jgi:hypothetical protein